jgi:hypothetical protein
MKRGWFVLALSTALLAGPAGAENVDPTDDDAQYAWGENVGWFNAEPLGDGGPGLQLDDFELTGWMWGENVGWVSASCKNTLSCDDVRYGVVHDGSGNLSGYAWGENVGWIAFRPLENDGSRSGPIQVTVDLATGIFGGKAFGENVGWIVFDYATSEANRIRTSWSCSAAGGAPGGHPDLTVDDSNGDALLSWTASADATGHDVVYGDLLALRASSGDFAVATSGCAAENTTFDSILHAGDPGPGEAVWFLLRDVRCSGNGTYDVVDAAGEPLQLGSRDAEVDAAPASCD